MFWETRILKNKQYRLKFSISLENFNLYLQSSPPKKALVGGKVEALPSRLKLSVPEGDLDFLSTFGLLGKLGLKDLNWGGMPTILGVNVWRDFLEGGGGGLKLAGKNRWKNLWVILLKIARPSRKAVPEVYGDDICKFWGWDAWWILFCGNLFLSIFTSKKKVLHLSPKSHHILHTEVHNKQRYL